MAIPKKVQIVPSSVMVFTECTPVHMPKAELERYGIPRHEQDKMRAKGHACFIDLLPAGVRLYARYNAGLVAPRSTKPGGFEVSLASLAREEDVDKLPQIKLGQRVRLKPMFAIHLDEYGDSTYAYMTPKAHGPGPYSVVGQFGRFYDLEGGPRAPRELLEVV